MNSSKKSVSIISQDKDEAIRSFTSKENSFIIHEWRGSGPDYMHVHYEDDEAWHVLEGSMTFKFPDREVEVFKGETVFVPAGVAHSYTANNARYLIILTPTLNELISELQNSPYEQHAAIMKKYRSEIL